MASEFLKIAEEVLRRKKRSMQVREIYEYAKDRGLFSDKIAGKTPHQTLKSKLSQHIREKGDASQFVRTGPGLFNLRDALAVGSHPYNARRLRKPDPQEAVLVFPRERLIQAGDFQGVRRRWKKHLGHLLAAGEYKHMDRMEAEGDDNHKQVITYVMITRRGALLCFRRGNYHRAADFLRGAHCVGFGGHVISNDDILWSKHAGIEESASRELQEELRLPEADVLKLRQGGGPRIVGILNDDSSAVGRRHFAVLLCYEVSDSRYWDGPKRGEKSVTQLRWLNRARPTLRIEEFEYWSQLCIKEYFPNLITRSSTFKIQRRKSFKSPHIICLVGLIGSGKTETSNLLVKEYGYTSINSGQILAKILGVEPVPHTSRVQFQQLAAEYIDRTDGPRNLAAEILKAIKNSGQTKVVVDGIRHRDTFMQLKRLEPKTRTALLYVYTPPDEALEFYREREKENADMEEFLARRHAPVESEVESLLGESDAVLYNWKGRSGYEEAVHALMFELKISRLGRAS